MNSDRALFTRILCQFLLGGGLRFLLAVALLAANAHQLFDLTSNSPSPYVLLCIFVCGLYMYIGFGAAITVPVRPCGRLDTLEPRSHQELLDRSEKYAFVTPDRFFRWCEFLF